MIHGDGRDHRDGRRLDNVGRIEPPAKARFQQQEIRRISGKGQECRGGRDLEERDGLVLIRRLAFLQDRQQHIFPDGRPVEHDTLVKTDQMRRRIGMNRQARRLRDCTHEGNDRPFAVGPRDMNHRRQAPFRVSKRLQQTLGPVQP